MVVPRRARRASLRGAAVGIATVSVLLCTAAVIERRDVETPLGELLASAAGTSGADGGQSPAAAGIVAPLRGYAVLQPGDCDGRLALTATIGAELIELRGLVVDGAGGLDTLRGQLARDGVTLSLAAAPRRLAERLRAMGHTTTPLVVVLDAEQRVTYAAPLPRDEAERARLTALLHLLRPLQGDGR